MTDTPTKTDLLPEILFGYDSHEGHSSAIMSVRDSGGYVHVFAQAEGIVADLLNAAWNTRTQPTADIEGLRKLRGKIDGMKKARKDHYCPDVHLNNSLVDAVLKLFDEHVGLYQASQKGAKQVLSMGVPAGEVGVDHPKDLMMDNWEKAEGLQSNALSGSTPETLPNLANRVSEADEWVGRALGHMTKIDQHFDNLDNPQYGTIDHKEIIRQEIEHIHNLLTRARLADQKEG